jgi:hypothetical protein
MPAKTIFSIHANILFRETVVLSFIVFERSKAIASGGIFQEMGNIGLRWRGRKVCEIYAQKRDVIAISGEILTSATFD